MSVLTSPVEIERHEEPPFFIIDLQNFTRVEVEVDRPFVVLKSGCWNLPIAVSESQLASIENGLNGKIKCRPTTHDLMADILENYGLRVLMVKVVSLKNDVYYARLVLFGNGKVFNLDAKPSDAIALAVRKDAPIYVNTNLLYTHGKEEC